MRRALFAILILAAALSFAACPRGDGGASTPNDSATASANSAGESAGPKTAESAAPDKPLEIPRKLSREIGFPAEYKITEASETRDGAHVVFTVNPPLTAEIAQFYIGDLETKGYHSDDNASRILEGVTFAGGKFQSVYIKVTETYKDGTSVTIDVEY